MSKQWWSSRAGFITQGGCLLALFAWSVHRAPTAPARGRSAPAASEEAIIDNSEDAAVADDTAGESDGRFVAPPTVRFRTDNPPADSLNLRPVEQRPVPWQPVHPQNPPRRLPGGNGPHGPFEVSGKGATVYNAPPPDAD